MAIPQNKEELLHAIEENYAKLRKDLVIIPPERTQEKTMDGHAKGTCMSIADQVSYLIGWGELVLKWHNKKSKNEPVDFPETGFKWNELGLLAQKFYEDYDGYSYAELLEKLDQTVDALLELIRSLQNEQLFDKQWYKQHTLGRMIQLNTSSPYKNARTRVRRWKKAKLP